VQNRPQSTPAVPTMPTVRPIPNQGMPVQQPLPGFQHVHQQQLVHQAEQVSAMMFQRLRELQNDTVRLQNEIAGMEHRNRALATGQTQGQPGNHPANHPLFPLLNYNGHNALANNLPQLQQPQISFRPPQMAPMPPSVQNLINQQRERAAAEGRQGAQATNTIPNNGSPTPSGRASPNIHRPNHTTTHTREGVGPNGERWQITVNETTTTFPAQQPAPHHHPQHPIYVGNHPALNLEAILRGADRIHAAQNMQNNVERTTSNPLPTGASTSSTAQGQHPPTPSSDTSVAANTPATTTSSTSSSTVENPSEIRNHPSSGATTVANLAPNNPGDLDPMAYVLMSPEGPRALLFHGSQTYYTPRLSSRRRRNDSPLPPPGQGQGEGVEPARYAGFPEFRNRNERRGPRHRNGQDNRQENNPLEPVNANAHANPGAGALGAQIGPMLWLLVRLAGFVWFFTAGNSSWTRFFMVTGLAVVVFVINTGIFNGIAEQLWGPIRRHVEALIPLAGPEAALVPAANAAIPQRGEAAPAGDQGARRRRHGELDPAEVAAHLLEQHRQRNGGWLMAQIRRAEHAALLFLASLVPGVGERHIAAREAEANAAEAERQRNADAAAATANAEETNADQTAGSSGEKQDTQEQQPENAEGEAAPVQPLIEV
jgi:hypothetical protein